MIQRFTRLKTTTTRKNITQTLQIMLGNHGTKTTHMAETINMSKDSVCHIKNQDVG